MEEMQYREHGMKKLIIIGVLIVMAIAVCCMWGSMVRLERQVRRLENQLHNLGVRLTNDVQRVSDVVSRIREEAQWWTEPVVEVLHVEKDESLVRLTWQIRELQQGSEVALNYQVQGSGPEFERIVADEIADGVFTAVMSVSVPLEPLVHIQVVNITSTGRRHESHTAVETMTGTGGFGVKYFISMQDGDRLAVGNERRLDLGKISHRLFSPLGVTVTFEDGSGSVRIVTEYKDAVYPVQRIDLEMRDGRGAVVGSWQMSRTDEEYGSVFELDLPRDGEDETLVLVLEYGEGIVVERALYNIGPR